MTPPTGLRQNDSVRYCSQITTCPVDYCRIIVVCFSENIYAKYFFRKLYLQKLNIIFKIWYYLLYTWTHVLSHVLIDYSHKCHDKKSLYTIHYQAVGLWYIVFVFLPCSTITSNRQNVYFLFINTTSKDSFRQLWYQYLICYRSF